MTDRDSSTRDNRISCDESIQPAAGPDPRPSTHVVQIPKEQLYRDGAFAAANRRTILKKRMPGERCLGNFCIFCCVFLFAIILLLLLLFIFFEPKLPKFAIDSFVVDSVIPGFQTEFRVRLIVKNPNPKSDVLYKKGDAGLLFADHEQVIGNGSFPSFNQPKNVSTDVEVVVKQSNSNGALQILDMEKLLKQATHQEFINLVFKMNLVVRFENWSVIWGDQPLDVDCHLSVYTLAKGSTLLAQICKTDKA